MLSSVRVAMFCRHFPVQSIRRKEIGSKNYVLSALGDPSKSSGKRGVVATRKKDDRGVVTVKPTVCPISQIYE